MNNYRFKLVALAISLLVCLGACTKETVLDRHYVSIVNGTNQELVVKYSVGGKPSVCYVPNKIMYNSVDLILPSFGASMQVSGQWSTTDFNAAFDFMHVHKLTNVKDTSAEYIDIKDFSKYAVENAQLVYGSVRENAHTYKHTFNHIFP
jgi:hypothetical protein